MVSKFDKCIRIFLLCYQPKSKYHISWRGQCTPLEEEHTWEEAWYTLESIKGDGPGQVQAIGVSNFDENTLKALLDIANKKISVVQNWMDPFHQVSSNNHSRGNYKTSITHLRLYCTRTVWCERCVVITG